MNQNEITRIEEITCAIHRVLNGDPFEPIAVDDSKNDEIRQLSEFVNRLVAELESV